MKKNYLLFISFCVLIFFISCSEDSTQDNIPESSIEKIDLSFEKIEQNTAVVKVNVFHTGIGLPVVRVLYRKTSETTFKEINQSLQSRPNVFEIKDLSISTKYIIKVIAEKGNGDIKKETELIDFNTLSIDTSRLKYWNNIYPNERFVLKDFSGNINQLDFSNTYFKWSDNDSLKVEKTEIVESNGDMFIRFYIDESKVKKFFTEKNDKSLRKVDFDIVINMNDIITTISHQERMSLYSYFPEIKNVSYNISRECSSNSEESTLSLQGDFWFKKNAPTVLAHLNPDDLNVNIFDNILISLHKKEGNVFLSSFTKDEIITSFNPNSCGPSFYLTQQSDYYNAFHQTTSIGVFLGYKLEPNTTYIVKLQIKKDGIIYEANSFEFTTN
ncbi:hypothetical protein [uncultured Tenacibaculum sp.]|uniref:hypothetical protein n=1 Tax=uncultured Tenacibaculum sp. TaxID=174713 RepID=UPI00260E0593|nr:hypothetical protein [uncultured Tenacibaculum sp.]